MKKHLVMAALAIASLMAVVTPAQSQQISPNLKKMLGGLPIAGIQDDVQKLVGTLKKTSCGGGLSGCYMTKSGSMQLYFFTSASAQQTFLLVLNQTMALPPLLKPNVQKVFGGTAVKDLIISISTSDYTLDALQMPPDLQKVVRESYFNVNALEFAAGVQLAARANLGGTLRTAMLALGVQVDQMTMRAGVVMPIPTDLTGGAGSGIGLAGALNDGDTMKKAGADALHPGAFVELQLGPNSRVQLSAPNASLTDTTFYIDNELVFGYKGNARFAGTSKDFLLQFQTPLTPEGAMDLLDFSFRMAMPQTFTLEDYAYMSVAMVVTPSTPMSAGAKAALNKYGGGYIGNIKDIVSPLKAVTKPLSVFQLKNPNPAPPYKFGDRSKPFPATVAPFNVYLFGPLADGGPKMHVASDVRILGQTMGKMEVTVGKSGFNGMAEADVHTRLGPLGKQKISLKATAKVNAKGEDITLVGNLSGQKMSIELKGETLKLEFSASCINPFKLDVKVSIQESMDIAQILEGEGGINVDPSKLENCVGKDLEAAYKKVAGEYKNLSGFTANEANKALNKISSDAEAAYNKTKDAARDAANKTSNGAMNAFKDAGNAFKKIGKKKKHHKGPDPLFASSVFDWDFYYDTYPDVVKAGVDLAQHWKDHGANEGRQGAPEFSAKYYRARYLDVQQLCGAKDYQCAIQHWLDEGLEAGRQGSPDVAMASYLKRYPDLAKAFGRDGYFDAMEHWFNNGEDEHRNPRPEDPSDGPIYGPEIIGGDGGGYWTDINFCGDGYVTGFRLNSGKTVDTIQFAYGSRGWSTPQGGDANKKMETEVILRSGEYIVSVDYRNGSRVDQLTFHTNTGRTFGPYGGGGGTPGTYRVTSGEKLGCMAGRAGSSIDRLVFSSTGLR